MVKGYNGIKLLNFELSNFETKNQTSSQAGCQTGSLKHEKKKHRRLQFYSVYLLHKFSVSYCQENPIHDFRVLLFLKSSISPNLHWLLKNI